MNKSPDDFDSPWKMAFHNFLPEFVALFFPKMYRAIDWSRGVEFLDKEFLRIARDAKLGRSHADVLVKVWLKNGQEVRILIHIEVQSQRDAKLPERMYVYNYRAYDKYRLVIWSLAVLADESKSWRPKKFENRAFDCVAGLHYPIIKLSDFRAPKQRRRLERSTNPFALLVPRASGNAGHERRV